MLHPLLILAINEACVQKLTTESHVGGSFGDGGGAAGGRLNNRDHLNVLMGSTLYGRDFAVNYDAIYGHKDYTKEVAFLDAVWRKYGVPGKRVLDVGCGTGSHARLLSLRGYSVLGIDQSKSMVNVAAAKAGSARFKVADMRTFRLREQFDIIACMFSVINYNLTRRHLVATLRNFKRHLADGGVIMFDFPFLLHQTTPQAATSARFLSRKRVSIIDVAPGDLHTRITSLLVQGPHEHPSVIRETHDVRTYSLEEMRTAASKARLRCRIYWDFSLKKKKGVRPIAVCTR